MSCDITSNGFVQTAGYVIGPSGEQLTETDGQGNWMHTNVFAAGQLLATYSYTDNSHAATDTYFALSDWLGTKRAVVSAGGCGTGYVGLPYGGDLTATSLPGFTQCPDATEHHFTGKERDAESGNDYFGARYYSSAMGRWLSPDWAKNIQAVPYADFTHPQTLNLYNYTRNNPLGGADSDGHCPGCDWLVSVVSTKVSTYLAQHPDVAKAISEAPAKVLGSLGIKVMGGVGGSVGAEGAQLKGQATAYVSYTLGKGAGAGADVTGTAQLGSAGGSVNVNAPIVKDGQLANPIGDASVTGSGSLSGANGKAEGEASTSLDESSIGGTYGEGLVGGVEVSADMQGVWDVTTAMFNDAIDDAKQLVSGLEETMTCGVGGCAHPPPPPPPQDQQWPQPQQ
jgi:RHS repeat-associated protein